MEDRNKSSQSSADSSSASQSQGALDSSSGKQLVRWMEGINHELADLRSAVGANARMGLFREQIMTTAIDRNTSESKQLREHVAKSLRLNREVVNSEQAALDRAAKTVTESAKRLDDSAEHLTQKPEPDEAITATHLKVRWLTLAKYVPFAAKFIGLLAVIGGAAWALLKGLAKYLPGHH